MSFTRRDKPLYLAIFSDWNKLNLQKYLALKYTVTNQTFGDAIVDIKPERLTADCVNRARVVIVWFTFIADSVKWPLSVYLYHCVN